MIRRFVALGVVPVMAGLGVAVAAPAGAASTSGKHVSHQTMARAVARMHPHAAGTLNGTCSLVVPSTIHLMEDSDFVDFDVSGDCASREDLSAAWYAGGPTFLESPYEVLIDHDSGDFSSMDSVGVFTWKGWFAFDDAQHTYTQNSPKTTVKVGSWAGLQTVRSGSKVTINTRAVRYATSYGENVPWAGATGLIQYRTKGSSTWNGLKNVKTDSAGAFSYSYTMSATRDYRAVYAEQPTIWGTTSPTSTR